MFFSLKINSQTESQRALKSIKKAQVANGTKVRFLSTEYKLNLAKKDQKQEVLKGENVLLKYPACYLWFICYLIV